jgi:magnesium chelatase subunit D
MSGPPVFPFSAIAGQEALKRALVLNAVDPSIGGALIRGDKGTAKSTAVRALAALLPPIPTVAGCPFNCDPHRPPRDCPWCAERLAEGAPRTAGERPVPLVDLPVAATEDRLAGSFNLEVAIQRGVRRFEPGLLAAANRGILYVDEVNLLPDHLVDVVLDAAASGTHRVEREGISVSHAARFVLVGTMNPEEGDLRPQLLDRFGLAADVSTPRDVPTRAEIVRRRVAFDSDPERFAAAWASGDARLGRDIQQARTRLPGIAVDDAALDLIARICVAYEVDGLRADIVIYKAAVALAALDGRTRVGAADVRAAATLALPHRRRRDPFDDTGFDPEPLDRLTSDVEGAGPQGSSPDGGRGAPAAPAQDATPSGGHGEAAAPGRGAAPAGDGGGASALPHEDGAIDPGMPYGLLPRPAGRAKASGRSGRPLTGARYGHHVASAPPRGQLPARRLAFDATLRAAAPSQAARGRNGLAVHLRPEDLRERVLEGRPGRLLLFVVDASGSMAAQRRMALARGAVRAILLDAYRSRDQVALIAFGGAGARLVLPATSSVDLAERRLSGLATGGRTPLAQALDLAHQTLARRRAGGAEGAPLLVLVTDGRANAAAPGVDPWAAALAAAGRLRAAGVASAVVDADRGSARLGLSRALAGAMGGPLLGPEGAQERAAPGLVARIRRLAAAGAGPSRGQGQGAKTSRWV